MVEQFGYVLSGPRRGASLAGDELRDALLGNELAWAHLDYRSDPPLAARGWIADILPDLEPSTLEALTGDVTRPRSATAGNGVMLLMRDTPDEMTDDADDMPSIRMYIDRTMIISLSRRPARSLTAIREDCIADDRIPATPAMFLHDFLLIVAENAAELIERLAVRTDDLEDALDIGRLPEEAARNEATILRRTVLALRRYLGPQRDALDSLRQLELFPKGDRRRMAEVYDRNVRLVEELDLLTNRLVIAREGIAGLQADRLNRQLVFLSIVSVFFLPLGFLTSLLGVNLGGIPGSEDPWGFWIFCGLLSFIGMGLALAIWMIRRR